MVCTLFFDWGFTNSFVKYELDIVSLENDIFGFPASGLTFLTKSIMRFLKWIRIFDIVLEQIQFVYNARKKCVLKISGHNRIDLMHLNLWKNTMESTVFNRKRKNSFFIHFLNCTCARPFLDITFRVVDNKFQTYIYLI